MTIPARGLVTAYLLARVAGASLSLLIVAAIACPAVWSQDLARRARARETLQLLIRLLYSRRIR